MASASPVSIVRLLAISGTATILISCAGSPTQTAEGGQAEDTKSAFKSAGADIGCGIASILNKDCAKGARTGAQVAEKMISWVFKSLKIADGKTINKEYETKKIAVSKSEIEPKKFTSKVETTEATTATASPTGTPSASESKSSAAASKPATPVASSEVKVTSNTDLVGYGDKVPTVTQKYALYDENNKLLSTQTEKVAAVDGAGRYETEARIKIPRSKGKGANQYRVETTLMVNGKEYKKNSYRIALIDDGQVRLALFVTAPVL